jgi:dynein heavy chain
MTATRNLTRTLYHLNDELSLPLHKIRGLCLQITKLSFFKDNNGQILALEEWVKQQELQLVQTRDTLNELCSEITEIVLEACKKALIAAGFGDKFKDVNDIQDFNDGTETKVMASILKNSHLNSLTNNDQPYQMSYTELSQKRSECKRLMNFIRLTDYLITDALLLLNHRSVTSILEKVKHLSEVGDRDVEEDMQQLGINIGSEDNQNIPLYRTEVILKDKSLLVIPSRAHFEKRVEKVVSSFLDAIKVEKLLKKRKIFAEFLDPVLNDRGDEIKLGEGPDIESWATREMSYKTLKDTINQTLSAAFHDVENYKNTFEGVKQMYLENERMDIEVIRRHDPPLDYFRTELQKYKQQIETVNEMKTAKYKGIFYVDSKKLKVIFQPSPQNCLQQLHKLLPELAREKNDSLFQDLNAAVIELQSHPSSLEAFVQYLHFVQKISSEMESLEERYRNVTEIYQLLEEEKVEVSLTDRDNFSNGTVSKMVTLLHAIGIAEESREEKIEKFSQDITRKFQDLRTEVQDIREAAQDSVISDVEANVADVINYTQTLKDKLDRIKQRSKELAGFQEIFKIEPENIEELGDVNTEVELKLKLWTSLRSWQHETARWKETTFFSMDAKEIQNAVDKYAAIALQVQKGLQDNPVVPKLTGLVDEWKIILPTIQNLKNPALRKRHWRIIDNIIGRPLYNNKTFLLGELVEMNLTEKGPKIEEESSQASNEQSLEDLLKTVKENWHNINFDFTPHKDLHIIASTEDIITQLEDDRITVATILSSRYVTAIKDDVETWEQTLKLMYDTIHELLACQVKWLYLENVFSAPDISYQLKDDFKLFSSVDRFFKDTMKQALTTKKVRAATTTPGLYEKLRTHNTHLTRIEKSLEDYLQTKRNAFPRFYFLSNADLLDILSQTKNPQAVQPHLANCFEGINRLEFDGNSIVAMLSKDGEKVPFTSKFRVRVVVEEWLIEVEKNMRKTLRDLTDRAIHDYVSQDRETWILTHHSQIVQTVSQIFWQREVTERLTSENPKKELRDYFKILETNMTKLAAMTRSKLKSLQRKVVASLIIIEVHGRDVVDQMIQDGVQSVTDFGWMKQLRYYWDKNRCVVRQTNSEFEYGNEYLGTQSRLVITPLTDRVYMTLTGALHLNLGGSPSGPAGTGKTETVKDLAKALALPCIVYNCSDGVTYEMMYKFFSGVVQVGAWACFDEFNRINIEVLSVIATQLTTIQDALKQKRKTFFLQDDKEIKIVDTCGVFITMNPGYAGRSELPDNLKALFRPVAVMMPDYRLIAEVILLSEGYENAKILSRKMTQLYKLSNEQLSAQDHYDFGMRAMKSVLVMAGELKRANPDQQEEITLMKAMKDSNIPKFVKEDVSLFEAIVSDLFPKIEAPVQNFETLQEGLEDTLRSQGLEPVPKFVTKLLQLYDTMIVRHGVMLVGPTGSGKSTCRNVLSTTLTKLSEELDNQSEVFKKVKEYTLNPKSITYGELYGVFNLQTHEWYNGLIPHFAHKAKGDRSNCRKWIIFDGPVDTLWIESLNSVLDDSRLLCLDNTERIQLDESISFVFEVQDLAVASPATVSRCGMVYMDSNDLGWQPYVKSWLNTKLPEMFTPHQEYIAKLFEDYVPGTLEFVRNNCKEDMITVDLNLVTSLCDFFSAVVKSEDITLTVDTKVDIVINNLFTFSVVWSIGANIVGDGRFEFDKYIKNEFKRIVTIPSYIASVYDFWIDFSSYNLVDWSAKLPDRFEYNPSIPYFQILVPTVDTVRYAYMMNILSKYGKPVLYNGVTGVGKSVMIANTLKENKEVELVTIQFSAQTSSKRTQEMIESKLVVRKNVLQAPPGKKVVLFVDDLNMPEPEEFFAQPPIELLRQLLGYGGFYDVDDKENFPWKEVQDVTVAAACGPGRNNVTPRLLRLFHSFYVPEMASESLARIFTCILEGFLEPFNDNVRGVSKSIVRAAIDLYNRTCQDFRPTPNCAHYTFNMRDLSKVFQGILQVSPDTVKTSKSITKLWVHESLRCFHDRLISDIDRNSFKEIVVELLKRHFKSTPITFDELFGEKPVTFGSVMNQEPDSFVYEEIVNPSNIPNMLDTHLINFNMKYSGKMDLVFFPDAAIHATRLVRILKQPRGNALLVGVGGSGKQSLSRLASFIAGYRTFEITLTRGYKLADFRVDLQNLYKIAGVEGKPVTFILTDSQIVSESFLEDVNNILNSGEVPNLFPHEEREKVINELRPIAADAGISEMRDAIYAFFINRVRDNLHIVLCMSPVGEAFRRRIRMFPSLVNCCTIDWIDEWPEDALRAVAERKFLKINIGPENLKQALVDTCVTIHQSAVKTAEKMDQVLRRKYYITPASFLEFIGFYHNMLERKRLELKTLKDKYAKGIDILRSTNEMVEHMQKELEERQPILQTMTIEVNDILERVQKATEEANRKRELITKEEKIVNEKTKKADAIAKESEDKLNEVLPKILLAKDALDKIDRGQLTEIKKYVDPRLPIKITLEAVLTLLGEKNITWESTQKTMSDVNFLNRCLEFDKDALSPALVKRVKKFEKDPNYENALVMNTSSAAGSLNTWVRAMVSYYEVKKLVEPLEESYHKAQKDLQLMQKQLKLKQQELAQVQQNIENMNQEYEENVLEKTTLEEKIALSEKRLIAAKKLTISLADEYQRWTISVSTFDKQIENLPGNVFLAAAAIVYYGAFTASYRTELVNYWTTEVKNRNIPLSEDPIIEKTIANPVQIRGWNIKNLPTDSHSIQNAILATETNRWPLMIDPQGQANRWIKQMESENGLKIVKQSDKNCVKILNNALTIGKPVIIEDLGEIIDPTLEPILQKLVYKVQGRTVIKLGTGEVDYNPNFKLYLTTKIANPHYLPEICNKVNLINFTVTTQGLEDQLLGDVVLKLREELEKEKDSLVVSVSDDTKSLVELEDQILDNLSSVEGNILDNEEIIRTLDESKFMSNVINDRVQKSAKMEIELNATREEYRSVAVRGSILYFVIADLARIDPMYQYSLEFFKKLFNNCVEKDDTLELQELLSMLINRITQSVYLSVCRGLFEKDKLIFSFMMATQISRNAGVITDTEWNAFIRGVPQTSAKNEFSSWLGQKSWDLLYSLDHTIPEMEGITMAIARNQEEWAKHFKHPEAYKSPLPRGWDTRIKLFHKLLLMKCFCEEKVMFASRQFVLDTLGPEFTQSPKLNLQQAVDDTTPGEPIIFVLSQGADPTDILKRFAEASGVKLHTKSLGQGQEESAEKMIERGRKNGEWVLLQNCHLSVSFMPTLEKIISEFSSKTAIIKAPFRLWLTSMPSKDFPIPILQNSIKLTNEPPKGIPANLSRTYDEISDEYFNCFTEEEKFPECSKNLAFTKLLFGLSLFHAVIQERKKFGPLGWNVKYEFNDSDLEVAKLWLQIFLKEQENIPWDSLQYVIGEIVYGGRVTDPWDRRCLINILHQYFTKDILLTNFQFADNNIYKIPHGGDKDVFKQFINALPAIDRPEIFSMHENADIVFQMQETNRMLETILYVQPRTTGNGGESQSESIVSELAKNLLETLPADLDKSDAGKDTFIRTTKGAMHSLSTVLSHEMLRFNKLLRVIRTSLKELLKAMDGLVVMSAELEMAFNCLLTNKVPPEWADAAYPSLKPLGSWIEDLKQRVSFMHTWLRKGPPKAFWLSGFFFPQGFLTGVLQTYARENEVPVDTLGFKFHVLDTTDLDEISDAPKEGVYVYGMFMDGARWDPKARTIVEALPGENNSPMPVIHFKPERDHTLHEGLYECPLYKTSVRKGDLSSLGQSTNFVIAVEIPSEKSPTFWVKQGAALLCQLDE